MKIFNFDIERGVYSFEFSDLETELHAHPVVEIISATEGHFSIELDSRRKDDLTFAIIDANTKHKVSSHRAVLSILMVECNNSLLANYLSGRGVEIKKDGLFAKSNFPSKNKLIAEVHNLANTTDLKSPIDLRIKESITYIQENEIEYKSLMTILTSKVFLSESRLSHLFKQHVGISIKKYLVWDKLRKAVSRYLMDQGSLTEVSLQSGFFDQAHLSKSFKSQLGISPSKAYNSRILQSRWPSWF